MSLDRDQLKLRRFPVFVLTATTGMAQFKTGFIDGTGSMTIQLTSDLTMSSRLLKSSLSADQSGAQIGCISIRSAPVVRLMPTPLPTSKLPFRFGL